MGKVNCKFLHVMSILRVCISKLVLTKSEKQFAKDSHLFLQHQKLTTCFELNMCKFYLHIPVQEVQVVSYW